MDGQRILVSKYGNNDLLVRPLFCYDPKAVTGSFSRPGQGHPTNPWLVGPRCTVLYRGVGHGLQYVVHRAATHPTLQTLTQPEGALERREAPPPPPPRTSSWIRRTRCHRPTLDRIVRDTIAPEPPLPPLRQAAAAPATTTCEMASDSTPSSNPDGLRLYILFCFFN
jgi:hypothetical protein